MSDKENLRLYLERVSLDLSKADKLFDNILDNGTLSLFQKIKTETMRDNLKYERNKILHYIEDYLS